MSTSIQSQLSSMQAYTAKVQAEQSRQTMGTDKLDKQAFLRLLTEQLKNQDPLKPMDNMQFLQQQAALSQVEELQNLSKVMSNSNSLNQASSMIGKTVTVTNPDNTEETLTGVVTAANMSSTGASIEMNGTAFPISLITRVENTPAQ